MSDTITAAAIEAAHSALLTACPNLDEANGACTADEEECFAVHPVHFAWQQAGQYGVVGDTRAIAKTVLDAAAPVLLADHDETMPWHYMVMLYGDAKEFGTDLDAAINYAAPKPGGYGQLQVFRQRRSRWQEADSEWLAAIARGSQPADSGGGA